MSEIKPLSIYILCKQIQRENHFYILNLYIPAKQYNIIKLEFINISI